MFHEPHPSRTTAGPILKGMSCSLSLHIDQGSYERTVKESRKQQGRDGGLPQRVCCSAPARIKGIGIE